MPQVAKALWSTAYHEAGHAVMAWHERVRLTSITIEPDGEFLGAVRHADLFRGVRLDADRSDRARLRVERRVRVCLAGGIAEKPFNPKGYRRWSCGADHEQALDALEHLCRSAAEVEAWCRLLDIQTQYALDLHWPMVEGLAGVLIERSTLRGGEIEKMILRLVTATDPAPGNHSATRRSDGA